MHISSDPSVRVRVKCKQAATGFVNTENKTQILQPLSFNRFKCATYSHLW